MTQPEAVGKSPVARLITKRGLASLCAGVVASWGLSATAGEHGGKPAPQRPATRAPLTQPKRQEHGGTKAKEHGGKEHGGEESDLFTAQQIKTAMNDHIQNEAKKGKGTFQIVDPKTGETLSLEFVKIHDPVRVMEGKGYFACTDFHPRGTEISKLYDLDFWLNPVDGKLVVTETKIHKHPKRTENGSWEKEARYTFMNDEVVEIK